MFSAEWQRELTVSICVHLPEDLVCAFLRRGLVFGHLHHGGNHLVNGLKAAEKDNQWQKCLRECFKEGASGFKGLSAFWNTGAQKIHVGITFLNRWCWSHASIQGNIEKATSYLGCICAQMKRQRDWLAAYLFWKEKRWRMILIYRWLDMTTGSTKVTSFRLLKR